MLGGDVKNVHGCFRCDRKRPECIGAQNYNHEKKYDNSLVRNQEVTAYKLKELKEASHKRKEGRAIGGSNDAIHGEALPSWDELLGEEDSHDGNTFDWTLQ